MRDVQRLTDKDLQNLHLPAKLLSQMLQMRQTQPGGQQKAIDDAQGGSHQQRVDSGIQKIGPKKALHEDGLGGRDAVRGDVERSSSTKRCAAEHDNPKKRARAADFFETSSPAAEAKARDTNAGNTERPTGDTSFEHRVTEDGVILQTNTRVKLAGLSSTHLNDRCGVVTAYTTSKQRWRIQLDTGGIVEVKAVNLR